MATTRRRTSSTRTKRSTPKRDASRALSIVTTLRTSDPSTRLDDIHVQGALSRLAKILTKMDARTGRRDPTSRPRR